MEPHLSCASVGSFRLANAGDIVKCPSLTVRVGPLRALVLSTRGRTASLGNCGVSRINGAFLEALRAARICA